MAITQIKQTTLYILVPFMKRYFFFQFNIGICHIQQFKALKINSQVIQAGKDHLESHGAGLSSVRFICGTQNIHKVFKYCFIHSEKTTELVYYSESNNTYNGYFLQKKLMALKKGKGFMQNFSRIAIQKKSIYLM